VRQADEGDPLAILEPELLGEWSAGIDGSGRHAFGSCWRGSAAPCGPAGTRGGAWRSLRSAGSGSIPMRRSSASYSSHIWHMGLTSPAILVNARLGRDLLERNAALGL